MSNADTAAIARELRSIRKGLDRLRAEMKATASVSTGRDGAVKRIVAAKMMGVGITKLDELVKAGTIRTAVDVRLIPLAEVRRYCAPKLPRRKAQRYDRLLDAGDEARTVRDALDSRRGRR